MRKKKRKAIRQTENILKQKAVYFKQPFAF
jgi:hypothetical protein